MDCWLVVVFLLCLSSLSLQQKISLMSAVQRLLKESDDQIRGQLGHGKDIPEEYDFIVVGGGTAGCTLAARLSEVAEWSVLLVEAGGPEQLYMDIPVFFGSLLGSETDWQYRTKSSNNYCMAFENNECHLPRGKVMGGTSTTNSMIATRGNRRDYDIWAKQGNPGWSYDEVLPFFIKAENITFKTMTSDHFHGSQGPLSISEIYHTELADAFLEAGDELGHMRGDYDGESQNVFSYFHFTEREGKKSSASRAYLYPVLKKRKNLYVRMESFATKIFINEYTAHGIEFVRKGETYRVKARKEVIVTSGTINSPQILMLSGIGPADHLASLGIPLVKDLKVGHNFQEHISAGGLSFTTNITSSHLSAKCMANDPKYFMNAIKKENGPWEVPVGVEAVFYYDINNPNIPHGYPDLELLFATVSPIPDIPTRGFRKDVLEAVYTPMEEQTTWTIQPIIMRPKSRGRLTLKSANPFEKPNIHPNFLEEREDITMILKGVHKAFEISQTKAFQKYNSRLSKNPVPSCRHYQMTTDKYWECALRHLTLMNYHPCCTCKMGPKSDPDAVVDSRLKVHGIDKLRVVDASIMPQIVSAHTNIPTNMIAERAADFIKFDHISSRSF